MCCLAETCKKRASPIETRVSASLHGEVHTNSDEQVLSVIRWSFIQVTGFASPRGYKLPLMMRVLPGLMAWGSVLLIIRRSGLTSRRTLYIHWARVFAAASLYRTVRLGEITLLFLFAFVNISWLQYLSVYGSAVLLLDLGLFFSFLIIYTVGRTPWTGDQPVARPLSTHRTTQNKSKHPCLEWNSNPRSQRSNERRQFMP
jgi:hypothetical protein